MELKCLNLTMVPDIFGKNNQFVVHSALLILPTVQNNRHRFCKNMVLTEFYSNYEIQYRNSNIYLCPNVARFWKDVFKR